MKNSDNEVRFSLRIPSEMLVKVDSARQQRLGVVSRNTWLIEAISEKLQKENIKGDKDA